MSQPQGQGRLLLHIPPFTVAVDDCLVDILEVLEHRPPWGPEYTVAARIRCHGIATRTFDLTVRDTRQLLARLRAEIAKLKILVLEYGPEEAEKLLGGGPRG